MFHLSTSDVEAVATLAAAIFIACVKAYEKWHTPPRHTHTHDEVTGPPTPPPSP